MQSYFHLFKNSPCVCINTSATEIVLHCIKISSVLEKSSKQPLVIRECYNVPVGVGVVALVVDVVVEAVVVVGVVLTVVGF